MRGVAAVSPPPPGLEAASPATSEVHYHRGQVVPAGLAGSAFGRVHHGLFALVEHDRSDRAAVVELIGEGGTIGEANLIEPGGAHHHRLEVLLPSRVEWSDLASVDAARSADLDRAVLRVMAARTLLAADAAYRKRTQAISQQVAHALVGLSWRSRHREVPLGTCPIGQWDLARIVGSNRSSVNQICRRFQRRGWIDVDRTGIRVRRPQQLQAYADRGVGGCIAHREQELTVRLAEARAALVDLVADVMG
jgi:CRP-like cAMP-binding protein